jgi:hypothetical protein
MVGPGIWREKLKTTLKKRNGHSRTWNMARNIEKHEK